MANDTAKRCPTIPNAYRLVQLLYWQLIPQLAAVSGRHFACGRGRGLICGNGFFTAYLTERMSGLRPEVLYPPIDVVRIGRYVSGSRGPVVAMLARFGVSKSHAFVIKAFRDAVSHCGGSGLRLVLMGATEDVTSMLCVKHLMTMARGLGIHRIVNFCLEPIDGYGVSCPREICGLYPREVS